MSRFADEAFVDRFVDAINANSAFTRQAAWFDGSVLLADEAWQCWLKIYRGRVIDRLPTMPPLGYTFKLSGPDWAWESLATGSKRITELLLAGRRDFSDASELEGTVLPQPGPLRLEGDLMEAFRLMEAVYLILESYAVAASAVEVRP